MSRQTLTASAHEGVRSGTLATTNTESAARRSHTEAGPARVAIEIWGEAHPVLSSKAWAMGGVATSRRAMLGESLGAPGAWSASAARSSTVGGLVRLGGRERHQAPARRDARLELEDADRGGKIEAPPPGATGVHDRHHHVHQREHRPMGVAEHDDLCIRELRLQLL